MVVVFIFFTRLPKFCNFLVKMNVRIYLTSHAGFQNRQTMLDGQKIFCLFFSETSLNYFMKIFLLKFIRRFAYNSIFKNEVKEWKRREIIVWLFYICLIIIWQRATDFCQKGRLRKSRLSFLFNVFTIYFF